MAPQRLGVLPDVPTFAELGYKEMTEVVWVGLWTTPDVPAAAQAKVRDAVLKVLQQPKVREQFAGLGLDIGSSASQGELSRSLRAPPTSRPKSSSPSASSPNKAKHS